MTHDNPIVFTYWKDNEFQGFRADTFNTISKEYTKVYSFSRGQIDTVIKNIRSGLNSAGTAFAKALAEKNSPIIDTKGQDLPLHSLVDHMSKTEKLFREWGEFEVRVFDFPYEEEWREIDEGEEWKRDKIISSLKEPIEIHKFKVVENEN